MTKKSKGKPSIAAKRRTVSARAATKPDGKRRVKRGANSPAPSNDLKLKVRRLRTQLAEANKLIDQLRAHADTDYLLEIPNRRGFERELTRAIAYIQRYRATGVLIAIDVDRLKPINDTYGHAAGDEVLKAVTAVLARQVRASDVVGRLGGDEFALLLWNLNATDARSKAASLEEAIDQLSFTFRGERISVGASIGVAQLGSHSIPSRALEEADSAMYIRKAQRRHERASETGSA